MSDRERNSAGQFLPGHRSRGGRPKGFAGLAKLVQESTGDGAELVEFALAVFRDPNRTMPERMQAHQWLSLRGFGQPVAQHEIHADIVATAGPTMPTEIALGPVDDRVAWLRLHAPHLLTE